MKKVCLWLLCVLNLLTIEAQQGVGIGTTTPHPSAMVDVSKSNKGVLIPRLTTTARNSISNPADGLMVYDSTVDRLYQYQNGAWIYMLNNTYWNKSSGGNVIYTLDSVALGTSLPSKKLDVNGSIRGRSSLRANNDLFAENTLSGDEIFSSGSVLAAGTADFTGDVTTQGVVSISGTDPNPTIQFQSGGDNKVYIQAAGDDMRMGTNSGNATGKTIIRMNGTDIISIDTTSSLTVLVNGSGGNLKMGPKLCRQVANDNMLAVSSGRINADGTVRWTSDNTPPDVVRTGPGRYEIKFWSARVSARSAFLVTAGGTAPRMCAATFIAPPNGYYLKVEIYDPVSRTFVDADFNFIVHEPLNL